MLTHFIGESKGPFGRLFGPGKLIENLTLKASYLQNFQKFQNFLKTAVLRPFLQMFSSPIGDIKAKPRTFFCAYNSLSPSQKKDVAPLPRKKWKHKTG